MVPAPTQVLDQRRLLTGDGTDGVTYEARLLTRLELTEYRGKREWEWIGMKKDGIEEIWRRQMTFDHAVGQERRVHWSLKSFE